MENCKHEHKKDFSFYDHMAIKQPHDYCPDCKAHWFKGIKWTKEEWATWINDDTEFDTGSKDKGFNEVKTLGEAKDIFFKQEISYVDIVQNKFKDKRFFGGYKDTLGVHQYFIDADGDELGYYTPCMESLIIFATPRKVGIEQEVISVR